MKKNILTILAILSIVAIIAIAKPYKVVQIFRGGEMTQEYIATDLDYIEINDRLDCPTDITASESDGVVAVAWSEVEGATYNLYRSPDNVDYTILAAELTGNKYVDSTPLEGTNYYKVKAIADDVESDYSSAAQIIIKNKVETTGTINGHEYVDLGLPSGVRWATCNLGATSPTDCGDYYAWGEITPKDVYKRSTSVTYNMTNMSMNDITGNPDYDAAQANWGGKWRMPSMYEFIELKEHCKFESITKSGIQGWQITGPNGNQIFIPNGGTKYNSSLNSIKMCMWSSTPDPNNIEVAVSLVNLTIPGFSSRYGGLNIRPIADGEYSEVNKMPVGIVATLSDDKIIVSWKAVENMTYNLYHSTDNKNFTLIVSGLSDNRYIHINPSPGEHYYKVSSIYKDYESDFFDTARMVMPEKASGQINGYDYVDLGLPSGLKWATKNVAPKTMLETTPLTENDSFYAWGEIYHKGEYTNSNSTNYGNSTITQFSGNPKYDAARAEWGGSWRVPAQTELNELFTKCVWKWIERDDTPGYIVTGPNGNQIFFAAAGYKSGKYTYDIGISGCYWGSTSDTETSASCLYFESEPWTTTYGPWGPVLIKSRGKGNGFSIRAVSD